MAEVLLACAALAASYVGFALLALRQKPHHQTVSAEKSRAAPPRPLLVRNLALGCTLLVLSLACSLLAQGPGFGSILWVLLLAVGAQAVVFTLTYRPHWLRPLCWRNPAAAARR